MGEGRARVVLYAWLLADDGRRTVALYRSLPLNPRRKGWLKLRAGDLVPKPEHVRAEISLRLDARKGRATIWFDDVSVEEDELPKIPETGEVVFEGRDLIVWHELAARKVWPESKPPSRRARAVKLGAARGEYECFQLVVLPHRTLPDCRWELRGFSGPRWLPVRKVEYVNLRRVSGPYGRDGLQPDPLPLARPLTLQPRRAHAFWFTVFVPYGCPSKTFRGAAVLRSQGRVLCEIPIEVEVWNFSLPRRPSVEVKSHIWGTLVLRWHKGEPFEVLRKYYELVASHRAVCWPCAFASVRFERGRAVLDLSEFERHASLCRSLGMDFFRLPVPFFIGHKGTHRMPQRPSWRGIPIFADPECQELTDEFKRLFGRAAREAVEFVLRKGWAEKVTCKFFDEPNLSDERTVRALRTLASFISSLHPAIEVETAAVYPHPELTDFIKRWDLHTDLIELFPEEIEEAKRKGCFLSVYCNSVPLIDYPAIRTRAFFWALWRSGFKGAYCWWSITYWRRNPWEEPDFTPKVGGGILLYPPRPEDGGEPVPSIRWELMREGIEDYEYLSLLEREGGEEAGELLDRIRKAFSHFPLVSPPADQPYPLDPSQYERWREEIARLLSGR